MAVFSGNGSATAPSFTFSSDTNLGIFRSGTDELAFTTAGTERARLDASGNLEIGGTLGSEPNISLSANGTLQTQGPIYGTSKSGTHVFAREGGISNTRDLMYFRAGTGSSTDIATLRTDGSLLLGGSQPTTPNINLDATNGGAVFASTVAIGGTLPVSGVGGAPNISLNADGKANFVGNVISGGEPGSGANDGVKLGANGFISISRTDSSDTVFNTYVTGSNTKNIEFFANGASQFAGDMGIGGTEASPNITLNADGSADFTTQVDINPNSTTGITKFITGSCSTVWNERVAFTPTAGTEVVIAAFDNFGNGGCKLDIYQNCISSPENGGRYYKFAVSPRGSGNDVSSVILELLEESNGTSTTRPISGIFKYKVESNIFVVTFTPSSTGSNDITFRPVLSAGSVNARGVDVSTVTTGSTTEVSYGTKKADNVLIGGTLPASPNISLNADGSATFAGKTASTNGNSDCFVGIPDDDNFNAACFIGELKSTNGATSSHLAGNYDGTRVVNIKADGSAEFASSVEIGGSLGISPNISLNADGSSLFADELRVENNTSRYGLVVNKTGGEGFGIYVSSASTTENNYLIRAQSGFGGGGVIDRFTVNSDGSATFALDATINGVTVGMGSGSISTNTAIGRQALIANTTGSQNTAVGRRSLFLNTTGSHNTALGHRSLNDLTIGLGNIGIGGVNSAGGYIPVFDVTTENDRIVMGSTSVTNAYIKVAWTVTSDARDKTNFAPVPHGLDFVKQLEPTQYEFRVDRDSEETTGPVHFGFKAQDILALEGDNPVIIDNEVPEHLKIHSDALVPVLVNAIKELTAEIDSLKARLDAAGA